jgi:NDP-sugar pyrophosphorylase family protein
MKDYISNISVAVVAGGIGERLRHFTINKPKAMLEVGLERKPMLEFTIAPWIKLGIKNYIFCTGYKKEIIKDYFKDGSKFGINIEYSDEETKLETGGAIKNAMDQGKISKNKPIIVFYCDDLVRLNSMNFIKTHLIGVKTGFKATLTATNKFRTNYGILKIDKKIKKVIKFEEKPLIEKNTNVGIYFLEPEVLHLIDKNKLPFKFERVVLPELVKKNWLNAYEISWEDWIPVNTEKDYEEVLKIKLSEFYSKVLQK